MRSVILETTTRLLMGLLLVFSVFLLIRGHNLPGGGFAGGLVAATAFALKALSSGPAEARATLTIDPRTLTGLGLIVAVVSGFFGLPFGLPFLTGAWNLTEIPVIGKLGTPLLFDLGVYLVVAGITLVIIFTLAESEEDET